MNHVEEQVECYTISKATLDVWRQSLALTLAAASPVSDAVLVRAVEEKLGELTLLLQASEGPSLTARPSQSQLHTVPTARRPMKDASTQLLTVTGVSFAAQAMRRVRAERAARAAWAAVGRLGAATAHLANDVGVLLELAVMGRASLASFAYDAVAQREEGSALAESSRTSESVGSAGSRGSRFRRGGRAVLNAAGPAPEALADEIVELLHPATVEAVCATSAVYRSQAPPATSYRRSTARPGASPAPTVAKHFLRERLLPRVRLALREVQGQQREFAARRGAAFLCTQCRRDGRQLYEIDRDQRQLSRTVMRNHAFTRY